MLAIFIAIVWIPNDIESGVFEKVRRNWQIGDAFAPVLAVYLLGLGGLMLVFEAMTTRSHLRISRQNVFYVAGLLAMFVVFGSLLIRTGPTLLALFGEVDAQYRLYRDTAPWKYSGFMAGGTFIVASLISFMERRFSLQSICLGIIASIIMILIYDLPFDDLLLPPNGDY